MISLIQYFEADFLWKVGLKILNSEIVLKTFTDESNQEQRLYFFLNTQHTWALICRGSWVTNDLMLFFEPSNLECIFLIWAWIVWFKHIYFIFITNNSQCSPI